MIISANLPASLYVFLASPEGKFLKSKYLWSNWDVDELKARSEELKKTNDLTIGIVGGPFNDPKWKFVPGGAGAQKWN